MELVRGRETLWIPGGARYKNYLAPFKHGSATHALTPMPMTSMGGLAGYDDAPSKSPRVLVPRIARTRKN